MSVVGAHGDAGWAGLTRAMSRRVSYGTAYSLVVYLATRLAVAIGVLIGYLLRRRLTWHEVFTRLDAWWYQYIAQHGYGRHLRLHIPHDALHARYSTWAFYPGYPLLIRIVHDVTRLPYALDAFLLALVLAGVAVRAMYALGDAFGGPTVARGSAALVACWPGSAAMNLPYSEGLFVAATAGSLAALLRRRWLAAGILGAIATSTRAMGLALIAAAAAVAVREILARRDWSASLAPGLSILGAGAYYSYGWAETGDPLVWRHAENLWHQQMDFGVSLYYRVKNDVSLRGPHTVSVVLLLVGLAMILLMATAGVALRTRATLPLTIYAGCAAFMILAYSQVAPRPRMVLAVVPGFVWLARWLPPRLVDVVAVGLASTLALTAFLYVTVVVP